MTRFVNRYTASTEAPEPDELQWCIHAVYQSAADAPVALYRSSRGAYLDLDVNANAGYRSSSETIR